MASAWRASFQILLCRDLRVLGRGALLRDFSRSFGFQTSDLLFMRLSRTRLACAWESAVHMCEPGVGSVCRLLPSVQMSQSRTRGDRTEPEALP